MIILMGLAGSGKSTQGQMLAEKTGKVWLSAGQILRESGKFDAVMKEGKLVDDMQVVRLVAEKAAESIRNGRDVILDGFPRTTDQARWVADNIAEVIQVVVRFEVPREELIKRLELRGRADDTREAIEERFRIVAENIEKVCEILAAKGVKIEKMDGTGTPEEVAERLQALTTEKRA